MNDNGLSSFELGFLMVICVCVVILGAWLAVTLTSLQERFIYGVVAGVAALGAIICALLIYDKR